MSEKYLLEDVERLKKIAEEKELSYEELFNEADKMAQATLTKDVTLQQNFRMITTLRAILTKCKPLI
jgi:hypothetical protein